jgi:hypothetical protein
MKYSIRIYVLYVFAKRRVAIVSNVDKVILMIDKFIISAVGFFLCLSRLNSL